MKKQYDHELNKSRQELLSSLVSEKKNICIGGVSKESIKSGKEYLRKFAEGPCSPTIMLPGIGGSKLVAQINCEKLKRSKPDIFQACKWTECPKEGEPRTGKHMPKEEYTVWVPALSSPFSLTTQAKLQRDCFNGLMGLEIEFVGGTNGKPEIVISDVEGVEVKVYGASKNTSDFKTGLCGFNGMIDLLPFGSKYQFGGNQYYRPMM
jgi:hypothetical protein